MIELTKLSPDHIAQQVDTVSKFSNNIQPAFEKNASIYESHLYKFEEKLNAVKEKLLSDISCFLQPLKVLNYMDKMDRLHENYLLLKKYNKTLMALEEYVKWINKEEKLLNLASTTYPEIHVIREFIVPFMELIRFVKDL